MPTLPVEHFPQEKEAGCLAACAQMTLDFLGIRKSQRSLNRLFQLTSFGVPFSRLVRLQQFGVSILINTFGDENELIGAIEQNRSPIVFLRTRFLPYWQADTQHAVVVIGYDHNYFLVNDPAFKQAPQPISITSFLLAWNDMDYAYALVTR
jgi:ABC-type bacteriocin/lantibiotic exporter with double-glycine peptidase domain